jgi:hypothetical protein
MKKTLLYTLLVILISSYVFAQENSSEQIIVQLSQPGQPGFLSIEHIKGSIKVTGYEGEAVIVNASHRIINDTNSDKSSTDGMKRIPINNIRLTANEKNNKVTVEAFSPGKTIDLDIKVPKVFSLKIQLYYNGNIDIYNVSGEFELNNLNGHINLDNIAGSAVLNTTDGNMAVNFRDISKDMPMAFTTIYGKIDVTFPSSANISLKMKSDKGEIFSDFDMKLEKRKPRLDKSSETGEKKYILEEWTYGKINEGGTEALFKSYDGSIYIRKGK